MKSTQQFNLDGHHNLHLFLVGGFIAATLVWSFVPSLLMPAVTSLAGLFYFLYSQHLQKARLFHDLFKNFNERYDKLNNKLNQIATNDSILIEFEDQQILFDYFNLCGEEYLYYKNGFIDNEVWKSWRNGMLYFSSFKKIHDLWSNELKSGSYYGFDQALLKKDIL